MFRNGTEKPGMGRNRGRNPGCTSEDHMIHRRPPAQQHQPNGVEKKPDREASEQEHPSLRLQNSDLRMKPNGVQPFEPDPYGAGSPNPAGFAPQTNRIQRVTALSGSLLTTVWPFMGRNIQQRKDSETLDSYYTKLEGEEESCRGPEPKDIWKLEQDQKSKPGLFSQAPQLSRESLAQLELLWKARTGGNRRGTKKRRWIGSGLEWHGNQKDWKWTRSKVKVQKEHPEV
ncbi:hypothetical protein DFH09DRAFT_1091275 [Mycena vulgaris]|nr:hypothetical protein DFH09DRAFT_1091275 [Mycena vulgaris]